MQIPELKLAALNMHQFPCRSFCDGSAVEIGFGGMDLHLHSYEDLSRSARSVAQARCN